MSVGTGSWLTKIGLIAVLALAFLANAASESQAGKYSVVQCGWGVGKDADWSENASQRYNHSALCVPSGSDVWAGVEIRTYTRPAAGSAAAATTGRWRWRAPADTRITNVRGTWWHELHNHFQHRLGGMLPNGNFSLSHSSSKSRPMEPFVAGFSPGVETFESRLVCARAESKRCDTSPSSAAMVRALTLTLEDNVSPSISASGSAHGGGWLQGKVVQEFRASDRGGGLYESETLIDGNPAGRSLHDCSLATVGGKEHGRKMLPCPLTADGSHTINTVALSDGSHSLAACTTDFAGNRRCTTATTIRVDNNPPAAPVDLETEGGSEWRREAGFRLTWKNPSQGGASPIVAATFRVTGPEGYDSGEQRVEGLGISSLSLPTPRQAGEYRATVRLHDQAGHSSTVNVATAGFRFDDVNPEVGFRGFSDSEMPERLWARLIDRHSGPADGTIMYRPEGKGEWIELPTRKKETGRDDELDLMADVPSEGLAPGRYEFRVIGTDRAGNRAESSERIDGRGKMTAEGPLKAPTSLVATLEASGRSGTYVTAPFGADPVVAGHLSRASGEALPGRQIEVIVSPDRGSRLGDSRYTVRTGPGGEFRFQLGRSTSRRIELRFPGDAKLASTRAPDLWLRVGGGAVLRAKRKRVRTGSAIRLSGQVRTRDAVVPSGGKLVSLQYWEKRARLWRPVAFTRSDSAGRFGLRYRFRYITRPTRIRLRAVALSESGWPYATGVSNTVTVRVSPRGRAARR